MTEIKNPDAPATTSQTFFIFRLGGGDVRDQNLTRKQASDLIQKLQQAKGMNPSASQRAPSGARREAAIHAALGGKGFAAKPKKTKTKAEKPAPKKSEQVHPFAVAMKAASDAANEAGDRWLASATPQFRVVQRANPLDDNSPITKDYGTMLDVCGFAWVVCKDKRSKFARWCKANDYGSHFVRVPHKHRNRQELTLAEECARAAVRVFREHGINDVYMESRID